ncbi:MAG: GNAT family N-acetyltransferase [Desulfarculus sp.]|nr:GNAT family N-acetyltransferase [Desulfarculus sp.]MBI5523582.1 GNAT family N-acetyltransferase [Desulfarculus sp.]
MKLRRLTSEDMEQVIAIQQSITRQPVSPNWRKMLAQHVSDPCQAGLVAEIDDKVIGFILGEIKVGGFGSELTGWLEMVGVSPEHMGAGVGRALAQGLFEYFTKQGVTEVLTAVRWDSGDMLAFFKNLGFDRSPFINLRLVV